jgi:hypothetical protein
LQRLELKALRYSDVQIVPDISPSFFNLNFLGRKMAQVLPKLPIFGLAKSTVLNHVIKLLHFAS